MLARNNGRDRAMPISCIDSASKVRARDFWDVRLFGCTARREVGAWAADVMMMGLLAATFGPVDVILFLGLQSCGPAVAERPCVRAGCRLEGNNAAYAYCCCCCAFRDLVYSYERAT